MTTTTKLLLNYMGAAQAQRELIVNANVNAMELGVFPTVKSVTTTAAPGSPTESDCYIIPSGSSGVWAGKTNQVAQWISGQWNYFPPLAGFQFYCTADGLTYTYTSGGAWAVTLIQAGRNIIVNPWMEIDQAKEGAASFPSTGADVYCLDGWVAGLTSATASANGSRAVNGPLGYHNSLEIAVPTGASSVASGDALYVYQSLEANQIADWNFGLGAGLSSTLSLTWWAKTNRAPYTANVALQNGANSRSYVLPFTMATANVWQKFTAVIPGDDSGAWTLNGNGVGARIYFTAACGGTLQTPTTGSWQAANYIGSAAITQTILTTSASTFFVTGVKLEVSPVPTPILHRNYAEEILVCRRYYAKTMAPGVAPGSSVGTGGCALSNAGASNVPIGVSFSYPQMRAAPTMTCYDAAGAAGKITTFTSGAWVNGVSPGSTSANHNVAWTYTNGSAGTTVLNVDFTLDARL